MKITENAIIEIKKNAKYLVILVEPGGCKSFIYNYYYAETPGNYYVLEDFILTDEYSIPFLLNETLDYETEIGYEDFILSNETTSHCPCGKSFSI